MSTGRRSGLYWPNRMMLPAKAFLFISVLTSAEALAHTGLSANENASVVAGAWSASVEPHRTFRPLADRAPRPQNLEAHVKTTQGKGPVDVMSLSLGGALACFFVVAMIRRRKNARFVEPSPRVELPEARVLAPGSGKTDLRIKKRSGGS